MATTKNTSEATSSFSAAGGPIASDVDSKVKRAVGRLSENMHIAANEPSLALYCLQEHIRKEVPNMIKQRNDFNSQHRLLQGTCYDCDYSIGAVKSMEKSKCHFESIQTNLKNALFFKQQLRYDETRRKNADAKRKTDS